MDLPVLQKICLELAEILPGGFINKIHQPLPREILLRVRVPGGGEKKLVLSADLLNGRIHLTKLKIPNPPSPPRFCAFLRAHFQGARITEVTCAADDRVVRIAAVRGIGPEQAERELILELLGRDSNILLIEKPANRIMDCLHRIPQKETTTRVVLPDRNYEPPPKRESSRRICLKDLPPGDVRPGISIDRNGTRRLVINAMPSEDEVFATMNEAARVFFDTRLQSSLVATYRNRLSAPLRQKIRSLERRLARIEEDRQRLERFRELTNDGELLKASLNRAKKGMTAMEVQDWSTGLVRQIRLDPALTPVQNMERIFRKAAKGRRGEQKAAERLRGTLEERAALEDLLYLVEEARDSDDLDALASDLGSKFMKSEAQPAHAKNTAEKERGIGRMYNSFRTPSGLTALVGRSGRGNDFLFRRKAQKADLWLHVKGIPGAHVLLPTRERGGEATDEDVDFAAGLAVHFSKARDKGKVEVMVARVADLMKPKGAMPGQVQVKRYTTRLSEGKT